MTLQSALSSADSKAPYVRRLFHTIADRYDLITGLLSFGRDRRWKARLVTLAGVQPGIRALDLAAGTGDIAFALAARGARVAALDITHRMLQIAAGKRAPSARGHLRHRRHDGAAVSGRDLRPGHDRVRHPQRAGASSRRLPRSAVSCVRAVCSSRSTSTDRRIRSFAACISAISRWSGRRSAGCCTAIPTPIATFPNRSGGIPGPPASPAMLGRAGFADSRVVPLLGGLMAINTARRFADAPQRPGSEPNSQRTPNERRGAA